MKRSFMLFSLMAVLSVSQPNTAHALAGLGTGFIPGVVIGGILLAGGAVATPVGIYRAIKSGMNNPDPGLTLAGVSGLFMGFLFLDDDQGSLQFSEMGSYEAGSIGVTEGEMNSYNSELPEINAITQNITSKIFSNSPNEDKALFFAHQQWNEVKENGLLSSEAFSALEKISAASASK